MSHRSLLAVTGFAVAAIASVFVFVQLQPGLILSSTTPAGGDMGAHVWGPAFLRDSLLSSGRLSGWTPDWYAGFPAFQFYMVIPSLAIVALNAGLTPWLGVPGAVIAAAAARRLSKIHPQHKALIITGASALAVLMIGLPYGTSFKIIAVLGLVLFPVAAWWMGRLAGAAEPIPGFLALGSLIFLFDTNFTIYGGNIASTLAGEFAFSISLCLTLVAIGLTMRGMDHARYRASAAVVIALLALSHVIPLFFAVISLVVVVTLGQTVSRWWPLLIGGVIAATPIAFAERYSGLAPKVLVLGALALLLLSALAFDPEVRARAGWLMATGPVAALISLFWLLPFYLRSDYFNDMGWERLDEVGEALLTGPMRVALPIAVVGGVLAFATRDRLGMLFSVNAVTFASAVANLGESKLWNARLLPFFYLSVYLLAGIGIALVARYAAVAASERFERPDLRVLWAASAVGLVATLIGVGLPLRVLPFGSTNSENVYQWFGLRNSSRSVVPGWAAWNFSGYEEKNSYREYSQVIRTMESIGDKNGCGRAMWEYDRSLDRYGTPMALMLLPHWTDGCIGSMEGLYFESSATTPFHFLNQSALSIAPSSAQRDLPYLGFDINRGIAQLQVMGVRYYMAQSDRAIAEARTQPDLVELATSEPFVVFQVGGSTLVEGLAFEPVVASGPVVTDNDNNNEDEDGDELANRFETGWLSQAITFYNDPRGYAAMPAADGPPEWERVSSLIQTDGEPIEPAAVSNIEIGTDTISFDVDQVGKPVVVKASFFPNWNVSGADGPWRIGPNQMVVVPTDTSVRLSYGYTSAEAAGYLATLVGLIGLVWLIRGDRKSAGSDVARSSDEDTVDADNADVPVGRPQEAGEGALVSSSIDSAVLAEIAAPSDQ